MKLIINTAHQRFGGAVQVALSFINECKRFPQNEYHVWIGQGLNQLINPKEFPSNFFFYYFDFGIINLRQTLSIQKKLSNLEIQIKPNAIISTSGPTYFHSKAPQIIGFNLPLYIYPESPFIKSLALTKKLKLWLKKRIHFHYFKRDGAAFVVQTDDVNQRVCKAFKTDRVYTVSNTHSSFFICNPTFPNRLPEKKNSEIRLLSLSSYYPHKNLEIIPEIIQILREQRISNVRFVVTLKKEDYEKKLDFTQKFIMLGR